MHRPSCVKGMSCSMNPIIYEFNDKKHHPKAIGVVGEVIGETEVVVDVDIGGEREVMVPKGFGYGHEGSERNRTNCVIQSNNIERIIF